MKEKDKMNLVVLFDICNEIIEDTNTNSVAIREVFKMVDRLTNIIDWQEMEGIRSTETYDILYDDLYKSLSKLA